MGEHSFKKGFGQLQAKDIKQARQELMACLGIKTRQAFRCRLNGFIEPKVSEALAITVVFGKYGITDIWGE